MVEKLQINRYLMAVILSLWTLVTLAGPVPTIPAVAGTWQPRETAFAHVSARQQAVLSLPFSARITALAVEPGARVTAGEELASFDAPLLRRHLAGWRQARRELVLARKRLQVLRESEKEHAITRRDLAVGEQAVAEAEGKAGLAWETLAADLDLIHVATDVKTLAQRVGKQGLQAVARDLGRLRAPFTGVVTERRTALGEQLNAGDPVLELEALDRVYLDAGVPQASLSFWQGGETRWQAITKVFALRPMEGAPRYDADTGLWLLRFAADNPDYLLPDDAWVEVEHLGAPEPVVWVPAAAVVARGGKTWCIVQDGEQFKPVEVRVGPLSSDGRIPVLTGIKAGTRVVTGGAYELLYRDLKELIRFED